MTLNTANEMCIRDRAYARWVKYVNEYEEGASLYPGFEEIFEAFDGSIIQAVASAKTTAQYQIDFVAKGLDKYMKTAVLANDTVKHKPCLLYTSRCV